MSYVSVGLLTALLCVFAASGGSKVRSRAAQRAFADSLRLLPLTAVPLVTVLVARPRPLPLAGVLIALVAGAVAALILVRLDDLVDLFLPTTTTATGIRRSTDAT